MCRKNFNNFFKSFFCKPATRPTDKYRSMMMYLLPFTFASLLISSSVFIIFFSYLLPSLKHSFYHLKSLSSTQAVIFTILLVFTFVLTCSLVSAVSSFKKIAHQEDDDNFVDFFKHRKRINFNITMLFVAEILLLLLTVYLSCKVYLPKINVDEKPLILNQAEISKFVEEKLTWILKEDLAKDLMTLVDTVIM